MRFPVLFKKKHLNEKDWINYESLRDYADACRCIHDHNLRAIKNQGRLMCAIIILVVLVALIY